MTELVVETPEGLTLRHEVAGAGSRAAAAMIDASLYFVAMGVLVLLTGLVLELGAIATWLVAGWILAMISYHAFFGILWDGATPGKKALGLTVVDEHGLPAAPLQHVLRSMLWPVEALLFVPVPIGVVLMAATPRHQRLGDRVAGTLVLRRSPRALRPEPLRDKRWSKLPVRRLELVPAHASRFDGEDLAFLRDLIARSNIEQTARHRLMRRAARHYAAMVDHELPRKLPVKDARAVLAELFVFLREMRARS